MTKVFVSSTYIDLVGHRKAVDEIINRLGAQFRGMEYFGARPFEPQKACFDEINQCDIFVGIYAHRYGFVPEGNSLSITEQEFDFAQKQEIPIYCYVIESDFPWNPEFIETKASEKLEKFRLKINLLLRATFTTPDNLAKKVAADLRAGLDQKTYPNHVDIQSQVNTHKLGEITSTIGKKYIRELYVARHLDRKITHEINQFSKLNREIETINSSLFEIYTLLKNVDINQLEKKRIRELEERQVRELRKIEEKKNALQKSEEIQAREKGNLIYQAQSKTDLSSNEGNSEETKTLKEIREEIQLIKKTTNLANSYIEQFPSYNEKIRTAVEKEEIYYPATQLTDSYNNLKQMCIEFQKCNVREVLGINNNERTNFQEKIDLAPKSIGELLKAIRPISLVIDRAGGGKTNLFCRLAEDLGEKYICFFLAAKSVINPDEDGILKYFASSYPLDKDPVKMALEAGQENSQPIVVIIDGINECVDPVGFNIAIKTFIRRYYNSGIRFIISCRDIYWAYFKDTWWESHCSSISENELYSFTQHEFRKALPLYLHSYDILAALKGDARQQLRHPLLLRFFCEAFKGTSKVPSKIGRISNIRLLNLFDKYCERKFSQIAERLKLYSADEVFDFLKAIGRLMLASNSRSLSVEIIGRLAKQGYDEESIRTIDSKYIQILDEDILLEQKPAGVQMDLFVSFVYEEFMEYTIAKAIVSDLHPTSASISSKGIKSVSRKLLNNENVFVSVIGVIFYLGCFLAREDSEEGLIYIDWLIKSKREDIACRIISQWPRNYGKAFSRLIRLHKSGDLRIKKMSWDTMERISLGYWDEYFAYISHLKLSKTFSAMIIYTEISNACAGLTAGQRLEAMNWIVETVQQPYGDFRHGLRALKKIISESRDIFTVRQMEQAEKKHKMVNLGTF